MKYKVGDKVRVRKDLEEMKVYGGHTAVDSMAALQGRIVTIAEDNCLNDVYTIKEDDGGYAWTDEMFEGLAEEAQPEETVKLYTWQDLCDYEILLHEKWRIANEQRMEQGQELSVMHTLRQEYMKDIKMIINRLGREVPADKAKELGFEV